MAEIKPEVAFIGGGNMASALIGGLVQSGRIPATILVIEPDDRQRASIALQYGVLALPFGGSSLAGLPLIVWAVKPQSFALAARNSVPHVAQALHLSVMAGIRTDSIATATGATRIVRAMPNTPALIGQGIAGLFATPTVSGAERALVEQVLAASGELLWVNQESDLDAVTALSGSGPAYVFYFIEAMIQAAGEMGLTAEQGRRLALATFAGATALARQSPDSPAVLRERVTSKGGTTYAALMSMDTDAVKAAFVRALHAARDRARTLGDEFGHEGGTPGGGSGSSASENTGMRAGPGTGAAGGSSAARGPAPRPQTPSPRASGWRERP
jgi:pyrroline-5-carboxylate reductase